MKLQTWVPLLLIVVFASVHCSSPPPADPPASTSTDVGGDSRPAQTLPIPGVGDNQVPPPSPSDFGPVTWDVPADWTVVPPANNMRFAQYEVSDAECVVFYFGPGQGGDPLANARRWAGMFTQPDGRDSQEVMQLTTIRESTPRTHLVELTGRYTGSMTTGVAPAEPIEKAMLLGGIIEGPDAPWFFKFTGPETTVRAQRDAFIAMLESGRFGD